jgi:hypothetical protein
MKNTSAFGRPSRRDLLRIAAVSAAGVAVSGRVLAGTAAGFAAGGFAAGSEAGPLRSAGALAFGPENVLFVGDIAGAAVHAFALREKDVTPQTGVELGNFHNFEGRALGNDVRQGRCQRHSRAPTLRADLFVG